ncbi:mitotic spindle assembly checkpoint protein MAD1 [Cryptococcus deuterogattii LA55]|nr:mitotic spindle assembly checkpoint protein MAD1 [Cryptococcus deuterogattii LA55]KIR92065.1 mitotic spindle assembly checkpoint protein MAD1 [Cryptococcus deuterogattii CBS 10090]
MPVTPAPTLGKRSSADADLHTPSSRKHLSTLTSTVTSLERTNHTLQQRESRLAAQVEEQRLEIERLKNERYELFEAKMEERRKGEQAEQLWAEDRLVLTGEVALLRERNLALTNNLEELRSQHTVLSTRHASLAQTSENEISLLQARTAELERERNSLKAWENKAKSLSIELEEERARRVTEDGDSKTDDALQKEVKRQSANLAAVWRENEALKSEVHTLRHEKKSIDGVERAAKEVERALHEEIRVLQEQLERARRDMDSLTQTLPDPASTEPSEIATLRTRLSTLSTLHSQTTTSLVQRESTIRDLRARLADLAASSKDAVGEISQRATEAERELRWAKEGRESAERRERLVRRELEAVRRQLAAVPGPFAGSNDPERVKELESLVQSYKTTLEEIHRDSRDAEERIAKGMGLVKSQDLDKAQEKISQLEGEIAGLSSSVSDLTSSNTALTAEVTNLMQRVASGEFNPAYERCLELRNNPARKIWGIRKQELEDLKAENGELLERLAELDGLLAESQAGAGASTGGAAAATREGMVPRSSYDRLKTEKEELEKAHAKRLQRLKEIFTHKSKEFLEAVYSLLGWRIKFDESGSDIRLTSMYAPKGKNGLTIKFTSSEGHFGTMQMSGMMARSLEESRQFWVVERQSVPGFLAQVTTEMFEKTTIGRAAGYVGLG